MKYLSSLLVAAAMIISSCSGERAIEVSAGDPDPQTSNSAAAPEALVLTSVPPDSSALTTSTEQTSTTPAKPAATSDKPTETSPPATKPKPASNVPLIIFDTDMGPDIDDALALAMLHGYEKENKAKIAAVTISRNSNSAAQYTDLLNTFYGRPNIPIGVYRGTTPYDSAGDANYTRDIVNSGRYKQDLNVGAIPEGHKLMRQVLADAPDNSVIIVQVGFSTNTAKLLEDEQGRQLVRDKVKFLSVMAGRNGGSVEFNIEKHVPSAEYVFQNWPVEILQSEGNLGHHILYPLSSILSDFNYVANHPIKDSYLNSDYGWHDDAGAMGPDGKRDSYNMRSWDLTSVLVAVENPDGYFTANPPSEYFKVTGPGTIKLSSSGETTFTETGGRHKSLGVYNDMSSQQRTRVVNRLIQLTSTAP